MKPISAIFNVTDECSLRCKYCFTCPNPRVTTLQVAKDAIRYIANNWVESGKRGKPGFCFFGGEPTLYWDEILFPAAKWCREVVDKEIKGQLDLSITTNGQHLTHERIKKWKELQGTSILLSIDGVPEVQNVDRPRIDGKSSIDKILEIIPPLLAYFPDTTFRSTVTPYSVEYLFDSFTFAYDLGFTGYFVVPNMREPWSEESKTLLNQNFYKIAMLHYCDISLGNEGLKFWDWLKNFKWQFAPSTIEEATTKRCGLGTTSCGIGVEGEIFGCQERNTYDSSDTFYLGNIYTGGIEKERANDLLNKYSEFTKPYNYNNPKQCNSCPIAHVCSSLFCQAANLQNTGHLLGMSDMDCYWKQLMYSGAHEFLRLIDENKNEKALSWLFEKGCLGELGENCQKGGV